MGLSKSQEQQVFSHIRSKVTGGCPICGNKSWSVESDIQFLGILDSEYRQPIEGAAYPLVIAVCDNCYNVVQFQAKRLGIIE